MNLAKMKRLVTLLVTLFLALFFTLDMFWIIEYRIQDTAYQRPGLIYPNIFIIAIDQDTLNHFGSFQTWSRSGIPDVLNVLNSDPDYRPAVIGVDVMFIDDSTPALDRHLVGSVVDTDNILMASELDIGIDPQTFSTRPVLLDYLTPLEAMLPYVQTGFINGTFDRDNFSRSATLRANFGERTLYSFPVMAASMYLGVPPDTLLPQGLSETVISFSGEPGDFDTIPLWEVLEPDFDPTWFADAIILIGPYATGMHDHHAVPINPDTPMFGVEIHANILQQILESTFIVKPSPLLYFAIVTTLLMFIMAIGEFLKLRYASIVFIVTIPLYYLLAQFAFTQGYFLPIFTPSLAMGIALLYQIIYSYVLNTVEKNRMRNTFKKYVDPKLVDVLVQNESAVNNAVGERRQIAVMFIDVRGFTPLTEALRDTPEVIVEILNSYLEITSSAIFDNGGSVDKFIGDATMALFNGYVPLDDFVYKAAKAAWDIVQKADEFNNHIKEKYGLNVGFGVGVHCGEAIVGNLGPSFRKDYTAIGDTVNTAARLESNASASQVLISDEMYLALRGRILTESIGAIPLKGKSVPMEVYALTGLVKEENIHD